MTKIVFYLIRSRSLKCNGGGSATYCTLAPNMWLCLTISCSTTCIHVCMQNSVHGRDGIFAPAVNSVQAVNDSCAKKKKTLCTPSRLLLTHKHANIALTNLTQIQRQEDTDPAHKQNCNVPYPISFPTRIYRT